MRFVPLFAAVLLVACGDGSSGAPDASVDGAVVSGGDGGPPASAGHDLVYDDALGVVLLVNAGLGGAVSPPSSQPTRVWAWDGERWSVLDSDGPPIRNLGGVAYDAGRDVLVLHGGSYSETLSYGDTWEWKSGSGWRRVDVTGPGVRDHTQMAYDATRARVVLFGGQRDIHTFPRDTWSYDGTKWETVAASGPTPRVHHAMAYDPVAQRVVSFGGYEPDVADHGDTWAWNGSAWAVLFPEAATRTHARMAFDEGRGGLVLVGGIERGDAILVQRADGWHPLGVAGGPSARYLPGVAYDKRRHVLVVFGGGDPAGSALFGDTWELDGTRWTKKGG